jgi:hypothetical protein
LVGAAISSIEIAMNTRKIKENGRKKKAFTFLMHSITLVDTNELIIARFKACRRLL